MSGTGYPMNRGYPNDVVFQVDHNREVAYIKCPDGTVFEHDRQDNSLRRIEPDGKMFEVDADGNSIGPMLSARSNWSWS